VSLLLLTKVSLMMHSVALGAIHTSFLLYTNIAKPFAGHAGDIQNLAPVGIIPGL